MKTKILALLALAGASVIGSLDVQAQGYTYYGTGGTAYGATNGYAVISALSYNAGTPVVNYISASSDLNTSAIQFWNVTNSADCTATNSTTTLYAPTNNAFVTVAAGTVVFVRHMQNDAYEKLLLASVGNTNQLTVGVAPTQTVLPGDRIYCVSPGGKIPVPNTNLNVGPGTIYVGQKGLPLFIDIKGTAVSSINAVSATYQ